MRLSLLLSFCLLLLVASPGVAEDEGAESNATKDNAAATDAKQPDASTTDAAAAFDARLTEWKRLLTSLRDVKARYQGNDEANVDELQTEWNRLIEQGESLIDELRAAGIQAYVARPNVDRHLTRFLVNLLADDVARDKYRPAGTLARALLENGCDAKEVLNLAGIVAFVENDFDVASKHLLEARASNSLDESGQKYLDFVPAYQKIWPAEKAAREKDADRDDLPRVRIETSQGVIVAELFEDEAPGTVGNFVSLVDKKFYDGKTFHRVLPGFMAQGGCPIGNGQGGPGYRIYCECYSPKARMHFRGSLSMAHSGQDTGGSQFFITFVPTAHLNGKHTVFGRVIEGLDVLEKIQRINPDKPAPGVVPDKIIHAEVIRRRKGSTYEPNKVE